MKPVYHVLMKDGSLFPNAEGTPYEFHSLAEAKSWAMPDEKVIAAPRPGIAAGPEPRKEPNGIH